MRNACLAADSHCPRLAGGHCDGVQQNPCRPESDVQLHSPLKAAPSFFPLAQFFGRSGQTVEHNHAGALLRKFPPQMERAAISPSSWRRMATLTSQSLNCMQTKTQCYFRNPLAGCIPTCAEARHQGIAPRTPRAS